MDTKEQIVVVGKEIRYCIEYLRLAVIDRLGADREKTVSIETKKKGKVEKHRKDSRFPFELQFDELPYFSLYVNFKYAVYKHLLTLSYKENEITEEDLAEFGVATKNDEIDFKPLKEFATKPISCMALDLGALEEYLGSIEELLLYTSHAKVILGIFQELADADRMVKNHIGRAGELEFDEQLEDSDGDTDIDFIKDLLYEYREEEKSGNWFYSRIVYEDDNVIALNEEQDFNFPCGEQIGWAFMAAKDRIDINANYKDKEDETQKKPVSDEDKKAEKERFFASTRLYVVESASEIYYKKVCAVLSTVVNILAIPAYKIPYEVILDILSDTLAGMKRVVLASKLNKYTSGKTDRLFSRGELSKALGVASEKFSNCTKIYGDKTFTEEELHSALEKLGQPIDLLDFKIS